MLTKDNKTKMLESDVKVIDIYLEFFIRRYGIEVVEKEYKKQIKEKRAKYGIRKESGTSGNS